MEAPAIEGVCRKPAMASHHQEASILKDWETLLQGKAAVCSVNLLT
ncbi:13430_t:CDS:2 [Funneliformis caledonium]|uniref:13430_t:CDS:1 n=1 Tax=Funneliformis caledonium TaxID=1117310 RepID=A0A9N9HDG6_9GLOM|nr:13430_t:CDS:2 [Funneliformis caledonium]